MANVAQWTADQLLSQLQSVHKQAKYEWAELGKNSQAVALLYDRATRIPDPTQRAATRKALERWASRQARLQGDFNAAWRRFHSAHELATRFLRTIGIDAPTPEGLSGLGAAPLLIVLVPAAIVGAVTLAGIWFAAVHESNLVQREGLAIQARLVDARLAGQITTEDFLAMSREAADAADQKNKKNPLDDLSGILFPALAMVALIVVAPRLIPQRLAS